jgi:hypothetical protein
MLLLVGTTYMGVFTVAKIAVAAAAMTVILSAKHSAKTTLGCSSSSSRCFQLQQTGL